jgi:molybdate transport system regulatory protein
MTPRLSFRIGFEGGLALGHGKIALLEGIAASGSISAAARSLGMSYRRAWLLIDDLNRGFRAELVRTSPGGRSGGGAELTELGCEVVRRYRDIEARLQRDAGDHLAALEELVGSGAGAHVRPPRPHLAKAGARKAR